jgi:hypothetical protein
MISKIDPVGEDAGLVMGKAEIIRYAYEGGDLSILLDRFVARLARNPADAAALMDLSAVLGAAGQLDKAREIQAQALALRRSYQVAHGAGRRLKVLAFMTPGDFMANTPLEFLVENSDVNLRLVYLDAAAAGIGEVSDHDVAFMAVGESGDNAPLLRHLPALLKDWPRPILNNRPEVVAALTRDDVCRLLADEPALLSPPTVRVDRARLDEVAHHGLGLHSVLAGLDFPITIRPLDTHAGRGMEKIANAAELSGYLSRYDGAVFYIASFVDYSGPDGLFRKQRIVFIEGRAYPCHWATSDHWMVHYLSAEMTERPERRAEEEAWMADFDSTFAVRHDKAFQALYRRFGLDYFGIDCAELPDGRLLIFEADVAMIVHDLDSSETFPYKKPAMRRLFDAFVAMIQDGAG